MAALVSILVLLYYNYGSLEGFSNQDEENVANTSEDASLETQETDESEPSNSASDSSPSTSEEPTTQSSNTASNSSPSTSEEPTSGDIQNIKGEVWCQTPF